MNQHGRIQFTTVLMFLGIALGVWAVIIYGPIQIEKWEVRQTTKKYVARYTNLTERATLDLRKLYMDELNRIGEHEETDPWGNKKIVKGLGIKDDQITWEKDNVTGIARVGVTYTRTFQLKPLKKWKTITVSRYEEKPFR